jgi:hypothetical protein
VTRPIEADKGAALGAKWLRHCDQKGLGPFVAMFAAQTILTKCAEVARRAGNATAWNQWLTEALEILRLPEATS